MSTWVASKETGACFHFLVNPCRIMLFFWIHCWLQNIPDIYQACNVSFLNFHNLQSWSFGVLVSAVKLNQYHSCWCHHQTWCWHYISDIKVHRANMGPIWGRQAQVGPMLAPWTLLSGMVALSLLSMQKDFNLLCNVCVQKWCKMHTTQICISQKKISMKAL